jgi:hypothetical protein
MPCNMVHQPNMHLPVQIYLPGNSNWSIHDMELSQYMISAQEEKFWKRVKAAMELIGLLNFLCDTARFMEQELGWARE